MHGNKDLCLGHHHSRMYFLEGMYVLVQLHPYSSIHVQCTYVHVHVHAYACACLGHKQFFYSECVHGCSIHWSELVGLLWPLLCTLLCFLFCTLLLSNSYTYYEYSQEMWSKNSVLHWSCGSCRRALLQWRVIMYSTGQWKGVMQMRVTQEAYVCDMWSTCEWHEKHMWTTW